MCIDVILADSWWRLEERVQWDDDEFYFVD